MMRLYRERGKAQAHFRTEKRNARPVPDDLIKAGKEHWYSKSRSHRAALLRQEPGGAERQARIAAEAGITLHEPGKEARPKPQAAPKQQAQQASRFTFEELQSEFQKKPETRKRTASQPGIPKKEKEAGPRK